MKTIGVVLLSAILLLSCSAARVTTAADNEPQIASTPVAIANDADDDDDKDNDNDSRSERLRQRSAMTIEIDRADLKQPHILRVQGSPRLARAQVKINGKIVKSIANDSIELDLAPMMNSGRYIVDIFGTLPQSTDSIAITFVGKNSNITHQSSGDRNFAQQLIITVR